ncbi:MAG: chemotaxis protein CheB, partial [Opitutaceae bacterium]|nr:chemotaxis protein CheB [Cytophagales bacterium]
MSKINADSKFDSMQVITIGTSAGGLTVLISLINQLPKDFPAPILIVQHISADVSGNVLLNAINEIGKFICSHAKQGELIKPGKIYLAPPDHHLMVNALGQLQVTKGA